MEEEGQPKGREGITISMESQRLGCLDRCTMYIRTPGGLRYVERRTGTICIGGSGVGRGYDRDGTGGWG